MMQRIRHITKRIQEGRLKELIAQWRWMGIYIKRYALLVVVYTLLGASGSVLGLGTSMVSKELVDVVSGQSSGRLAAVAAAYVGVGVSQLLINAVKTRLSLRIRLKITNEIKTDIFMQILRTDWESLAHYRSGDLLYRINGDAGMVATNILSFIPNMVSVLITFGGALLVMLQNDPVMALIALGGAPLSFWSTRYSMRKMREYQKQQQETASSRMALNTETLQNLQMIKAFGVVDHFIGLYKKAQDETMRLSMDQNKYQSKMTVLTGMIGQCIGYVCYGFAIYRLWQGQITYGTMTMFVSMASSLRGSFSSVLNLLPTALRAGISAGRIMEIVNLPRESVEDEKEAQKLKKTAERTGIRVALHQVTFGYRGGAPVYENANLCADPGEIVGLIGPSGQGKTTTLRILLGLFRVQRGSAMVEAPGKAALPISSGTRCLFSYIPQGNTLFSGTIADNLRMLSPGASDEAIISALQTACAWEFIEPLPQGINTPVGEGGQRFSEGQKQRLSIARALLQNAPVLLLDEATSALDMATERRVLRSIMKRQPRQTVIVTAHRPSVLSLCSRVYKIQAGSVKPVDEAEIREFLEATP